MSLVRYIPPTYGTVEYPGWGLALGWCIAIFCIVMIPAAALYKLAGVQGSFRKVCVCVFISSSTRVHVHVFARVCTR